MALMHSRQSRVVLIEQFLQLASQVEAFVAEAANALELSTNDARVLLWLCGQIGEPTAGAPELRPLSPSELATLSGLPKNRIAESLTRLARDHYITRAGHASADQRIRAFEPTAKGREAALCLVDLLRKVERGLGYAMRTEGRKSTNLMRGHRRLRDLAAKTELGSGGSVGS